MDVIGKLPVVDEMKRREQVKMKRVRTTITERWSKRSGDRGAREEGDSLTGRSRYCPFHMGFRSKHAIDKMWRVINVKHGTEREEEHATHN